VDYRQLKQWSSSKRKKWSQIELLAAEPLGSTVEASKTLDDCKRKAFDNAAIIFSHFKTRGRLPKGGLKKIIKRATLQNGLENEKDWTIPADSVRSRQKWRNITNVNCGPPSPLAPVEPLLVELCIQRSRMGQPLAQSEGILLVNSIIHGTIHQDNLRRYQIDVVKNEHGRWQPWYPWKPILAKF
jgi:hypothetical protein